LKEKYYPRNNKDYRDQEFAISGNNGLIVFTPFSEEICTYIEKVGVGAYRHIMSELEL